MLALSKLGKHPNLTAKKSRVRFLDIEEAHSISQLRES